MASALRALRLLVAASCVVGQQVGEHPRKMQRDAESVLPGPWQTAFLGSGVNRGTGRPAAPRAAKRAAAVAIPVIVLKLPRSGSTWINEARGTFLCEEIITSKNNKLHDARAMLAHLIEALKRPMGKVGDRAGRADFSEDGHGRYCRPRGCLDVIGFTLNPNRAHGVDFAELGAAVPAARAVIFMRSNRVKAAVSRVRGIALSAVCGYNNIRVGDRRLAVKDARARADPRGNWTGGACKLRADVPVDVKEFKAALVRNYVWEQLILQIAYRDLAPRDVYEVTYEDVRGDQDAALGALFRWLGTEWKAGAAGPAKYIKATGEDLRATLVNYDEIDAFLRLEAPCLVPQLEETRRNISFDRSCVPFPNASKTARRPPRRTLE
ncbi:hypothetical protein M885DRAFT_614991 [Pelagophyceae sp. CCMP2097]|nr:hypothetical protein M885DRAFT_614991 [Pelagophyceae sp. CCMP2097]